MPEPIEVEEPIVDENADTFPREYVEKLRTENAEFRTKAKAAEEALAPLQARLVTAAVEKTGRLADPSDLVFDPSYLDDETALTAAIDALVESKPHLASRRVRDDIGQGAGEPNTEFNLAGLLSANA